MTFDRRTFLRFGALGGLGALGQRLPGFSTAARVPTGNTNRKLLVLFLRGGNDGVNTVIPLGDPTYPAARGAIAFNTGIVIPGSTYAVLHPALWRLQPVLSATSNGAAFLHAVGTNNPTRSHFVEMQKFETAQDLPATALAEEGFVPRLIERLHQPFGPPTLAGVSIADRNQRMFRTTDRNRILTHIRDLQAYKFRPIVPNVRFKGAAPSTTDPLGDALWGCCSFATPGDEIDGLIRATGENMCETETQLNAQVTQVLYTPGTGHDATRYPTNATELAALGLPAVDQAALDDGHAYQFFRRLEEGVSILRLTTANVVGIDLGGFDTHQNQLATQDKLLRILGFGLGSVHADAIVANPTELVVLVITEFGRTNRVNGSLGTDHGVGSVAMVLGSNVKAGVYNCAATGSTLFGAPWTPLLPSPPLPPTDPYADAVPPQTHMQTVFAEICERHFQMSTPDVDAVIPGFSAHTGRLYRRLGFL